MILKEKHIYNFFLESFNLVKKKGLFLINFSKLKKYPNLKILEKLRDLKKVSQNFERGIYKINFSDFVNENSSGNFIEKFEINKHQFVNDQDFLNKMENPYNYLFFFLYTKNIHKKIDSSESNKMKKNLIPPRNRKSKKNLIPEKKKLKINYEIKNKINIISKKYSLNKSKNIGYSNINKGKNVKRISLDQNKNKTLHLSVGNSKINTLSNNSNVYKSVIFNKECLENKKKNEIFQQKYKQNNGFNEKIFDTKNGINQVKKEINEKVNFEKNIIYAYPQKILKTEINENHKKNENYKESYNLKNIRPNIVEIKNLDYQKIKEEAKIINFYENLEKKKIENYQKNRKSENHKEINDYKRQIKKIKINNSSKEIQNFKNDDIYKNIYRNDSKTVSYKSSNLNDRNSNMNLNKKKDFEKKLLFEKKKPRKIGSSIDIKKLSFNTKKKNYEMKKYFPNSISEKKSKYHYHHNSISDKKNKYYQNLNSEKKSNLQKRNYKNSNFDRKKKYYQNLNSEKNKINTDNLNFEKKRISVYTSLSNSKKLINRNSSVKNKKNYIKNLSVQKSERKSSKIFFNKNSIPLNTQYFFNNKSDQKIPEKYYYDKNRVFMSEKNIYEKKKDKEKLRSNLKNIYRL